MELVEQLLALAARGLNALRQVGIDALVEPLLMPMRGRMVHHQGGAPEFLRYGSGADEEIYSVTRVGLNQLLLDVAENTANVALRFGQRAIGYDALDRSVHMRDERTESLYEVTANPLFAADNTLMLFGDGCHGHRFTDKTAEKWESRDRGGADHAAHGGKRHGFMQTAQIGGPYFTGHMQNGTCGHKEQCLVDDVAKGVGNHTIDGKLRSNSDTANHETDLVDEAVGKNPAQIVFNYSVKDRESCHGSADPDKRFGAGKGPGQGINRCLCCKSA